MKNLVSDSLKRTGLVALALAALSLIAVSCDTPTSAKVSSGDAAVVLSMSIDGNAIPSSYLTTVGTDTALDLGACFVVNGTGGAFNTAAPVKITSPFAGKTIATSASIQFKAYRYATSDALGAMFTLGNSAGRAYFTSASYLGYNATGGYYDANMYSYGAVTDYMNNTGKWVTVKITFSSSGYEVDVDGVKAFDQTVTANSATGAGTLTDYASQLTWLTASDSVLYFGTGSWWEVAADTQYVYVKDFTFTYS